MIDQGIHFQRTLLPDSGIGARSEARIDDLSMGSPFIPYGGPNSRTVDLEEFQHLYSYLSFLVSREKLMADLRITRPQHVALGSSNCDGVATDPLERSMTGFPDAPYLSQPVLRSVLLSFQAQHFLESLTEARDLSSCMVES